MSTTDAEAIARQFIQAWNAGEQEVVDEWAADDLLVSYPHFPEPLHGPDAFKGMLSQTHQFFPDLTITVDDIVAENERAVVRWTYRGTFAEGEMFGVQADDQPVEVPGMTLYHISDGAVQSERGIVDNFSLMMQLGAGPAAEK